MIVKPKYFIKNCVTYGPLFWLMLQMI